MHTAAEPVPLHVRLVLALALACLAVGVYWPVRCGEFVSDDFRFIVDHTAQLSRADTPGAFFTDPSTVSTPPDPDIWRPLRTSAFALELQAFGLDPCGFHAVSIGLHALVVVLVFAWAIALVGVGAAACGAALFGVHPLASEAVAWISSRADPMVAVAILLAILTARRCERTRRGWIGLALLAIGAGLAKESGVMLPALYLLDVRMRRERWLPRDSRAPWVAICVGTLVYLALYFALFRAGVHAQVGWYGGSFSTHLPYALLGLGTLVRLVFWPVDQHFLWEPAMFSPASTALVVGAVLATMLAFGVVVATRRRIPIVGLGAAWFIVALLPAANLLLPMRTVLAERFAYVPLCGVALAAAAVLRRLPRGWRIAVTTLLIVPLGVRTWQRATDFAAPRALYEATLHSWPRSSAAWMGLAELERERGAFDVAATGFDAAAAAALPDVRQHWRCRLAAATCRLEAGDSAAAVRSLQEFLAAVEADPVVARACADAIPDALFHLGQAHGLAREYERAAGLFEDLLARYPPRPAWLDAWGELERVRGDHQAAIELFTRALALDSDHHAARLHRALLLADYPALRAQALADLREILARDPDHARAREALAALLRDP